MKCYLHGDRDATGTCTRCGRALCPDCTMTVNGNVVCRQCTEQMASSAATVQVVNRKEPILSVVLSFLVPGLGQIYNGHVKKGIVLLIGYFLLCWTCLVPLVIWLYGMYDGYKVAEAINRGEYQQDWFS
ncbi:hypothetical protein [Methanocella sp. MCL-LM]|uniref:hypothetical protein n=1 Tax=Methanocella sp. MCL-LM TaxID=3412035 RepID=UPI003C724126